MEEEQTLRPSTATVGLGAAVPSLSPSGAAGAAAQAAAASAPLHGSAQPTATPTPTGNNAAELAQGWEERTTRSDGRTYYFNSRTGQTLWQKPLGAGQPAQQGAPSGCTLAFSAPSAGAAAEAASETGAAAAAPAPSRHGSAHYSTKAYWDARFATEARYEWLCEWGDLAPLLTPLLLPSPPAPLALWVLGNGTSTLPSDLASAFPAASVLATDYSQVVIAGLQGGVPSLPAAAAQPRLSYAVADMLELRAALGAHPRFGSVDAVFDKGAMDALVSAEGDSWSPAPALLQQSARIAAGVHAALRPGGRYIMLSFSQPHFRAQHLLQQQQGSGGSAGAAAAAASAGGGCAGEGAVGPVAAREAEDEEDEWEQELVAPVPPPAATLVPCSLTPPHTLYPPSPPPPPPSLPACSLNPTPPSLAALPPVAGSLWSAFEWHRVERGLGIFLYICTK